MPLRECAAATLHCLLLQAGEIYLLGGLVCAVLSALKTFPDSLSDQFLLVSQNST